jgi:hypothetical protein
MDAAKSPSSRNVGPWYESIFWGPLIIAFIGAFIAAFAQLASTAIPIYFGPVTLCDYGIFIEPGIDNIFINDNTGYTIRNESISVRNLNRLKPYEHQIYVKPIGLPPLGVKIELGNVNRSGTLPFNINMIVTIDNSSYKPGEYEILIQAASDTGMIRNCTYFLNIQDSSTTSNKDYRTYVLKWCCQNPQCQSLNIVESGSLSTDKKLKTVLVCGNCGIAHNLIKTGTTPSGSQYLDTAFLREDVMNHLPTGKNADDYFIDPEGNSLTRDYYIMNYGVDPLINLKFRKAGMPKSKERCSQISY